MQILCNNCCGTPKKTYTSVFKQNKIVCTSEYCKSLYLYLPDMVERYLFSYEKDHGYIRCETPSGYVFFCSLLCLHRYLVRHARLSIFSLAEGMKQSDKDPFLEQYRKEATHYNETHRDSLFQKHFPLTLYQEDEEEEEEEQYEEIGEEGEEVGDALIARQLKELSVLKEKIRVEEPLLRDLQEENKTLKEAIQSMHADDKKWKETSDHKKQKEIDKLTEKLKEKDRDIFRLTTRVMELESKTK